jgi:hypothetical protein
MPTYHLAQLNIGRLVAPTDDPRVAEFMDNLAKINALADNSPGFVWRLVSEDEAAGATTIRPFDDPDMLVNMSVWETVEALFQYVYYTEHTEFFRRRALWFERMSTPHMVLWWVPAGHIPTVEEAKERLEHLTAHGPTAHAFTFKQRFPEPSSQE